MGDDQNLLSQIKKLHLLPGTVYVIGAALFATGLYRRDQEGLFLGLLGLALVFFAVTINLLLDYLLAARKDLERTLHLAQTVLSLLLSALALWLAYSIVRK